MVPMAAAISSATNENAVLPIDRHSLLTNDPVQLGSAVASRISAERLNVKNLVLTHTEDTHGSDRKRLYLKEGREYFSGNLFVPNDGEIIQLS